MRKFIDRTLIILKAIIVFILYVPGLILLGLGWIIGKLGSLLTSDDALKGTITTIITLLEYKKKLE